jgi:hypothetical protein
VHLGGHRHAEDLLQDRNKVESIYFFVLSFPNSGRKLVKRLDIMSGGECQTKNTKDYEEEEEKPIVALDEGG